MARDPGGRGVGKFYTNNPFGINDLGQRDPLLGLYSVGKLYTEAILWYTVNWKVYKNQ